MKECPKNRQGNGNQGNSTQSSSVAPPYRDSPRGSTSITSECENYLYLITSHQEQVNSPDVVTGMIQVFNLDVYAFLDPRESLNFVTPYIANNLMFFLRNFVNPLCLYTCWGVYSSLASVSLLCRLISINHKNIMADLVELDMVDFDVILGMY